LRVPFAVRSQPPPGFFRWTITLGAVIPLFSLDDRRSFPRGYDTRAHFPHWPPFPGPLWGSPLFLLPGNIIILVYKTPPPQFFVSRGQGGPFAALFTQAPALVEFFTPLSFPGIIQHALFPVRLSVPRTIASLPPLYTGGPVGCQLFILRAIISLPEFFPFPGFSAAIVAARPSQVVQSPVHPETCSRLRVEKVSP